MKKIRVVFAEEFELNFPPANLVEFTAWLASKAAEIPLGYMANAKIEISARSSYDNPCVEIEIYYERPLTDEENAAERAEELRRARRTETEERDRLARLLAKYGPPA